MTAITGVAGRGTIPQGLGEDKLVRFSDAGTIDIGAVVEEQKIGWFAANLLAWTASLSADARALLGVASDFVQVRRQIIIGSGSASGTDALAGRPETAESATKSDDAPQAPEPGKLL